MTLLAMGVDGCRDGWIAVWVTHARRTGFAVLTKIDFVLELQPRMVMIEMPIGLPKSGYRACDLAAREMLGKGCQSRVFFGIRRTLLDSPLGRGKRHGAAYHAANALAKSNDGKGVSRQLFGILPKIGELDAIMTPQRQKVLHEAHPELVFQRLSESPRALPNKNSADGQKLRLKLLAGHGFSNIAEWVEFTLRERG